MNLCGIITYVNATASYVGITTGSEYIWKINYNSDAYNTWISDGGGSPFTTSEAFYAYSQTKGIKYEIGLIGNDQYFSTYYSNGVTVQAKGYSTTQDVSNDAWGTGISTIFNILSGTGATNYTYGLIFFSHTIGFAGKNINYPQGATLLQIFIENNAAYSSYSSIIVDVYSVTQLRVMMTRSGMSSPITFLIGFDSNGVMNSYTVNYGINTIISIELISGGSSIPGYNTIFIIGILILSIIGLNFKKFKEFRSNK